MSKRFGTRRAAGCVCTQSFTCGPCLRAAPPYVFTPSESREALAARLVAQVIAEGDEQGPYHCHLCGQRIDDGKPCGCGAR